MANAEDLESSPATVAGSSPAANFVLNIHKGGIMETVIETKNAVIAKMPNGATALLYIAFVEGDPTEAQIETGRNALTATLEIVGATNSSSYLLRHKNIELSADESLLLTVDSTYSKISPDPLPDVVETETFDETSSLEVESREDVATDGNVENDTTSTDATASAETDVESEASEA